MRTEAFEAGERFNHSLGIHGYSINPAAQGDTILRASRCVTFQPNPRNYTRHSSELSAKRSEKEFLERSNDERISIQPAQVRRQAHRMRNCDVSPDRRQHRL